MIMFKAEPLFVDTPSPQPAWKDLHRVSDEAIPKVAGLIEEVIRRASSRARFSTILDSFKEEEIWLAVREAERSVREAFSELRQDMETEIGELVQQGADISADRFEQLRKQLVAGRLDLTNPVVFGWITGKAATLVKDVSEETTLAIRSVVFRMFKDGIPPRDAARILRQIIGLTDRQANALYNFRRALEAGEFADLPKDLVERARRVRALGLLRQGKVDEVVERYRQRLIRDRAINIARTETITASAEGQRQFWQEATQDGLLDTDRFEVSWVLTPDDRLCPRCLSQFENYGRRPVHGVYGNGTRGPALHPSCRCAERLVRKAA